MHIACTDLLIISGSSYYAIFACNMPPKGHKTRYSLAAAARQKRRRLNEDESARQRRLDEMRDRIATARTNEDESARQDRLQSDRQRHATRRVPRQPNIRSALRYDATQPPLPSCIGSMTNTCVDCGALKWKGEAPGVCCSNGEVQLRPLQGRPPFLKSLLQGDSEDSKHFLANIRKYNSAFQMTSIGCKEIT
jgi:hypothetical protein